MKKLHLRFYELSKETQKELKQHIKNNIEVSSKNKKPVSGKKAHDEMINQSINELFELNNAGVDIDIYDWME